jgi:ankyrin repeat protein
LTTREIIKHTTDGWTKENQDDQKVKNLPPELQRYIQFMKAQGKESVKLTGLDCQQMLDAACASGILDETLLKDLLATDSNLKLDGTNRTLTPLMWAAMMGNPTIINLLIENGADVRYQLSSGNTPIFAIARAPELLESHVTALELLLQKGALLDVPNEETVTPLLRLCYQGWYKKLIDPIQIKLIELLLAGGANVNYQAGSHTNALMVAARHNPILLTTILKYNPNLELTDSSGDTALLIAAKDDNFKALELLKNAGANIDYRPTTYSNSALTSAAHQQKTERLAKLLQLGANTEVTDHEDDTALIIAAKKDDRDACILLLKHGANVNATTDWGKSTPLLIALKNVNFSLARLLLNATKQITVPDHISSFIPSLDKLLKSEHTDIFNEMLDKGLDDIIEKTPYYRHYLSEEATEDMKKILATYRSPEYKKFPLYKKLFFEAKRFGKDHKGAIILGVAGTTATVAVGAGVWYLFKSKSSSYPPTPLSNSFLIANKE